MDIQRLALFSDAAAENGWAVRRSPFDTESTLVSPDGETVLVAKVDGDGLWATVTSSLFPGRSVRLFKSARAAAAFAGMLGMGDLSAFLSPGGEPSDDDPCDIVPDVVHGVLPGMRGLPARTKKRGKR